MQGGASQLGPRRRGSAGSHISPEPGPACCHAEQELSCREVDWSLPAGLAFFGRSLFTFVKLVCLWNVTCVLSLAGLWVSSWGRLENRSGRRGGWLQQSFRAALWDTFSPTLRFWDSLRGARIWNKPAFSIKFWSSLKWLISKFAKRWRRKGKARMVRLHF